MNTVRRIAAVILMAATIGALDACQPGPFAIAGTATPQVLPYCAEEDGSGSPGAPCLWPANDRDIVILADFATDGTPYCQPVILKGWEAGWLWREVPCRSAKYDVTITEQPVRGDV